MWEYMVSFLPKFLGKIANFSSDLLGGIDYFFACFRLGNEVCKLSLGGDIFEI